MRNNSGQLNRAFLLTVLVLSLIAVFVTAENIVEEISTGTDTNTDASALETQPEEVQAEVDSQDEIIIDAPLEAAEENEVSNETETEIDAVTDEITQNETTIEEIVLNETTEVIQNETVEVNETPTLIVEDEITQNETVLSEEISTGLENRLNVKLFHSNKANRGEDLEIRAEITNVGLEVENIAVNFILPDGLEVLYNNDENCDILNAGDVCVSTLIVSTSGIELGSNQIKLVVSENE